MRTFGASVRQRDELNRLVTRAHDLIYGRPRKGWNAASLMLSFLAFPETVGPLYDEINEIYGTDHEPIFKE